MIKPEELRLNNYVMIDNPNYHLKLKDVVLSVTGISQNIWRGKSTHSVSLEHISQEENKYYETFSQFIKYIQPIELTEEWLKKAGFKKNGNYYWISLSNLKAELHVEIYGGDLVFIIKSDFCELILDPIKSVHQLQNLYFALTNKELTIK